MTDRLLLVHLARYGLLMVAEQTGESGVCNTTTSSVSLVDHRLPTSAAAKAARGYVPRASLRFGPCGFFDDLRLPIPSPLSGGWCRSGNLDVG